MEKSFSMRLAHYLRARFSFLSITTWEEERLIRDIKRICSDKKQIKTVRQVYTWSVTEGLLSDTDTSLSKYKQPIQVLNQIENIDEPAVIILKDFHIFLGHGGQTDHAVVRRIRDLVSVIEHDPNPKNVIFVSPTFDIPMELQKDIMIVEYGLPTYEEIEKVLDQMIKLNENNPRITVDLSNAEKELVVKAALGLTIQEAENAFALSMVMDGRLDINTVEHVLSEKQQIIKKNEILEYIPQDPSMEDIGGLENIKRWLKKRNNSWMDSASEYGLPAPKGLLITGVPGCGKSLIAKAVSSLWKLPLLKLDMGKIFSGIVGSSEENMRKAIETAEAIAPSILWIDEIEKGLAGTSSSGDSGTSSRIFATFLNWMQDKTAPVFLVATANDIQRLPPEFLRKGRFNEIFFVDLPTVIERKGIFKIHIEKRLQSDKARGEFPLTNETYEHLAKLTEGFIGAEIEQVVIIGLFEAYAENRGLQVKDLEKAIEEIVPLSITQAEEIKRLREWASVRAVTATLRDDRREYEEVAEEEKKSLPEDASDVHSKRGGRMLDF
ncbi:AAA family ATPase [Pseudogracilibacillus sp. SO30301A]|uniref:AAA family ATPase n=1 Tax=Pseudogracilibacillus sp. SO30301A TaxID=3098291 RepID=UPI00300E5081